MDVTRFTSRTALALLTVAMVSACNPGTTTRKSTPTPKSRPVPTVGADVTFQNCGVANYTAPTFQPTANASLSPGPGRTPPPPPSNTVSLPAAADILGYVRADLETLPIKDDTVSCVAKEFAAADVSSYLTQYGIHEPHVWVVVATMKPTHGGLPQYQVFFVTATWPLMIYTSYPIPAGAALPAVFSSMAS